MADEPVVSIRQGTGEIVVRHGDRDTSCDTLYSALGVRVQSKLASGLGALTDSQGYLVTDAHHATTVAGLYAAGDVSAGLNQITVAAGGAAIAAAAIHLALNRDRRK